jgi:hypothetical protein
MGELVVLSEWTANMKIGEGADVGLITVLA